MLIPAIWWSESVNGTDGGGEINGDGQPLIFLSSPVRSSRKIQCIPSEYRVKGIVFAVWCMVSTKSTLFPRTMDGLRYLCVSKPGFIKPTSSTPSTATLLTANLLNISAMKSIGAFGDSMDFLCSEEVKDALLYYKYEQRFPPLQRFSLLQRFYFLSEWVWILIEKYDLGFRVFDFFFGFFCSVNKRLLLFIRFCVFFFFF